MFLVGSFCLPVSVGIALIIYGAVISGRYKRSAFWFAIAIVGQSIALQLIEAGPFVRYQHYKTFYSLFVETNPLLFIFLFAQTILVIIGFRTIWSRIITWIVSAFKLWQLSGIGLIFFISSATVSRDISVYMAELPFATFVQTLNLATIVLMVWHFPEEMIVSLRHKFDKLLKKSEKKESSGGVDRFAIIAALWVTSIAIILSIVSYERHPHIPDEVAYLYHARYFAEGMLTMPAPPVPEAFDIDLMHFEADRWYSPVPPGWSAMLSLGVLFGAPWLVNPFLAGLNILLAYILIRGIYDRYIARITILLLCVSPWYIFMAMNFMTHTFTLTCALVGMVTIAWARRTEKVFWGWIGGIATGMIFLIRPLEGIAIAGLLGLWTIGIGGRRLKITSIVAFVLGIIIIGLVGLLYNYLITGDPTKFPIMAYIDKYYEPGANAIGFGSNRGLGWALDPFPGHGLLDALINANLNTFSVNIELFGWSTGSLILIAVMLFSGTMRESDYLMVTIIAVIIGIHTFYWFSGGPDFGARYWYLIIIPCVVLTVRGMQVLAEKLSFVPGTAANKNTLVVFVVFSLSLLALINYFPWRAVDKYHHYRGMRPDIRYLASEYGFGNSLVMIRGKLHSDYAAAATYNPVDLNEHRPVYAWNRNPKVLAKVLNEFQDRPVWFVDGPSITGNGFKVVAGPVATQDNSKK